RILEIIDIRLDRERNIAPPAAGLSYTGAAPRRGPTMLTPKDGTPKALRKLLAGQLLPLIREAPGELRLAEAGTGPAPRPPALPGHEHFFAEICFCLEGEA